MCATGDLASTADLPIEGLMKRERVAFSVLGRRARAGNAVTSASCISPVSKGSSPAQGTEDGTPGPPEHSLLCSSSTRFESGLTIVLLTVDESP
ncbi:hypothetical protein ADL25_35285 [Streptomyces sp. NRRL F-5122]|nr:hypothetical protein ADL25_35285 [Streptomyces sp. NRRL F-5122]